jgi:endoglucanase
MSAAKAFRHRLLLDILSQPSAPFREAHVIDRITLELEGAGVPHFIDPVGNMVIGAASKAEYLRLIGKKTSEPLRLFIAHMDHPGFIGSGWKSPTELEIDWHGGSPTAGIEGSKVWLASRAGPEGDGAFQSVRMIEGGRAIQSGVIRVDESLSRKFPGENGAKLVYGGFGFRAPVWEEDRRIYTKAADDLVGSFAIVSLALDFFAGKRKKGAAAPPFLGLLTRAEEVGFIGAIGHFELGWMKRAKRQVLCVSLETSRQLPGAEIGKGPIVRLGDRLNVFDPGAIRVFSDIAQKALPGRHQRRVMDGGTCEATVALTYGQPTIGISVPLGNYHNQNFEGGPDSSPERNGPAPEFVHLDDIAGLLELCVAAVAPKEAWNKPWEANQLKFRKSLKGYKRLLATGP